MKEGKQMIKLVDLLKKINQNTVSINYTNVRGEDITTQINDWRFNKHPLLNELEVVFIVPRAEHLDLKVQLCK